MSQLVKPDIGLDDLGLRLQAACSEFVAAAQVTLSTAIRIGELLTTARDALEPGGWLAWLEVHFAFSVSTASVWMRLAEYQHLVVDAESPYKAAQLLRGQGLPVIRSWGSWSAYPDWVRHEVVQLVGSGTSQRDVASRFGVSPATISRWVNPNRAREADQRKKQRRQDAARRKEIERLESLHEAARHAGGSVAKAYSTLRLHLQALDDAILETKDNDVRQALRLARNSAHQAEDRIAEALGVA